MQMVLKFLLNIYLFIFSIFAYAKEAETQQFNAPVDMRQWTIESGEKNNTALSSPDIAKKIVQYIKKEKINFKIDKNTDSIVVIKINSNPKNENKFVIEVYLKNKDDSVLFLIINAKGEIIKFKKGFAIY